MSFAQETHLVMCTPSPEDRRLHHRQARRTLHPQTWRREIAKTYNAKLKRQNQIIQSNKRGLARKT
jgi:hypothetical protein